MRILALGAVLPAGATLYFFLFWTWFDHWRRHRVQTYVLMLGTLGGLAVVTYVFRDRVFAHHVGLPFGVQIAGWALVSLTMGLGFWADRQLGLRLRAFTPFFEAEERIELRTTGAYAIVRHPIYASGIGFQLGVLLVTGYAAVAVALAVFALGALWFTRQEERRLMERLADPSAYERYRARVPALIPWVR